MMSSLLVKKIKISGFMPLLLAGEIGDATSVTAFLLTNAKLEPGDLCISVIKVLNKLFHGS